MAKGILGTKLGMTQIFNEAGEVVPVTVVAVEGNVVLQLKTVDTDGYEAVQLGFGDIKESRQNKPAKGHAAKANATPKRFIKEVRTSVEGYEIGQEIKADIFAAGELVDVQVHRKVKDSKVRSSVTDNHVDQWLTVRATTVVLVRWVLSLLTAYLKGNFFLVKWVESVKQFKTLKSLKLMWNAAFSS